MQSLNSKRVLVFIGFLASRLVAAVATARRIAGSEAVLTCGIDEGLSSTLEVLEGHLKLSAQLTVLIASN